MAGPYPPISIEPGSIADYLFQQWKSGVSSRTRGLLSTLGIEDHPEDERALRNNIVSQLTGWDPETKERSMPLGVGGITVGSKIRPLYKHDPFKAEDLELYKSISKSHPNLPERRKLDLTGWYRSSLDNELRTEYPDPDDPSSIVSQIAKDQWEKLPPKVFPEDIVPGFEGEFETVVNHPSFGYVDDFQPDLSKPPISPPTPLEIPARATIHRTSPLYGSHGKYDFYNDKLYAEAATPKQLEEMVAHESSHAAATQSNLARGTNTESPAVLERAEELFADPDLNLPDIETAIKMAYETELGELEARNFARKRRFLTPDEKRMSFPEDTFEKHLAPHAWVDESNAIPSATNIYDAPAPMWNKSNTSFEILENPTDSDLTRLYAQASKELKSQGVSLDFDKDSLVRLIKDEDGQIHAFAGSEAVHENAEDYLTSKTGKMMIDEGFWSPETGFRWRMGSDDIF